MAESTELREHVAPPPQPSQAAGSPPGVWAKIRRGIAGAFFWSYERGSWQYDVIVVVILAFIFLTPRAWFRHETNLGMVNLRRVQGVVEVAHDKTRHTYMMDARLLPPGSPQALDAAAQEVLQERLGKRFHVVSVDAVRDQAGVVLSYKVVVEQ